MDKQINSNIYINKMEKKFSIIINSTQDKYIVNFKCLDSEGNLLDSLVKNGIQTFEQAIELQTQFIEKNG